MLVAACTLTLPAVAGQGEFGGIPPNNVPRPSYKGATSFTIPAARRGKGSADAATVSLPKGFTVGRSSNLFVGPRGSFVSIDFHREKAGGRNPYPKLLSSIRRNTVKPGSQTGVAGRSVVVLARPWIGIWQSRALPQARRQSTRYLLCSKTSWYSMLASWPQNDARAQAEATAVARYVIWSIRAKP